MIPYMLHSICHYAMLFFPRKEGILIAILFILLKELESIDCKILTPAICMIIYVVIGVYNSYKIIVHTPRLFML